MNTRIEPERIPAAGLKKHLGLVVLILGGALALTGTAAVPGAVSEQ